MMDGRNSLPPYRHATAVYDAAIAGLPSLIAYGGWKKIRHAIPT